MQRIRVWGRGCALQQDKRVSWHVLRRDAAVLRAPHLFNRCGLWGPGRGWGSAAADAAAQLTYWIGAGSAGRAGRGFSGSAAPARRAGGERRGGRPARMLRMDPHSALSRGCYAE
jgi:hypothetical protein